jgi:DNA topoisomerase-6 subunit B
MWGESRCRSLVYLSQRFRPLTSFYRNRDLAGFSNPSRALYSAVREVVENSFPYDEPILIRERGRIRVAPIGEVVEERLSASPEDPEGERQYRRVDGDTEVLTLDENLELTFRRITAVFKHRSPDELWRLTLQPGRTVRTTSSHNVFLLNDNFEVVCKATKDLKPGERVIVPASPYFPGVLKEIDLLDELEDFPDGASKEAVARGAAKQSAGLWPASQVLLQTTKGDAVTWMELQGTASRTGLSRLSLPAKLELTPEFMRILGYYTSEGSISRGYSVSFSFGVNQMETHVRDLVQCLRKAFGIEPIVTAEDKATVNVVVNSKTFAVLFEKVLGAGARAEEKRVPWVVFNTTKENAEKYLEAYVCGEGCVRTSRRDRKTTLVTSSHGLFTDLKFLLTLLGKRFTTSVSSRKGRTVKRAGTRSKESYHIFIREGRAPVIRSPPTGRYRTELALKSESKTNPYRASVKEGWLGDSSRHEELPFPAKRSVYSQAGALPIARIEKEPSGSEWVYDIEVDEVQRFIGGEALALLHNSLDACEQFRILPEIYVRLSSAPGEEEKPDPKHYALLIRDNGSGVEAEHIPRAFGRVFYGSKYRLRQARGMFGMGGTMAVLYGQITTNKPTWVASSTDGLRAHSFLITIDIEKNNPIILEHNVMDAKGWRGTQVKIELEGDYFRSASRIQDYFKQTALVTPYAEMTFVDPGGRLLAFKRGTSEMPEPPKETLPHPHGIDVEAVKRLIKGWKGGSIDRFMVRNFHRVGEKIALDFLSFADIDPEMDPKSLTNDQIVGLTEALHAYDKFLPPDARCLSPLGEQIFITGIVKELNPEFSAVAVRDPAAYSGYPFIVEVGLAYGMKGAPQGLRLMRFANRIPLLYDEGSDVSWKVMNEEIDLKRYSVPADSSLVMITHICSTRIPYKTVGKEYIADRPEIEKELKNGMREVLRKLQIYLSRKGSMERQAKRLNIYGKYIPMIARFSAGLYGKKKLPNYRKLLGPGAGEGSQEVLDVEGE